MSSHGVVKVASDHDSLGAPVLSGCPLPKLMLIVGGEQKKSLSLRLHKTLLTARADNAVPFLCSEGNLR